MSNSLPIMEFYPSFQGEGYYTGTPAWFIRLQGCDVGCVWCDVKESWEMDTSKNTAIPKILETLETLPITDVIITGGEPTLYDLTPITDALRTQGYTTHLETAGTNEILGELDWITVSPKKFKKPLPQNFEKADELKVVIYHSSDLEWANQMQEKVSDQCKLYLQPEWSKADKIIPDIMTFIQNHPQWNISLQTHKYAGQP